ncbi:hypothetical protein Patl1_19556 [Pistacia atlantica]|uniref:Uncharacterized protein n=1 Tax=Pistacia atlantica TaxID=434234 RepID=A0ACC1C3H7_9ROSI|nr:hypothetical protein Patl1_19556 [Pistacia atlantica]
MLLVVPFLWERPLEVLDARPHESISYSIVCSEQMPDASMLHNDRIYALRSPKKADKKPSEKKKYVGEEAKEVPLDPAAEKLRQQR